MLSRKRYLTKSFFKLALECPTKLYYVNKKKYASTTDDNEFLAALAAGGFQVGELAKCLYPRGIEIETLEHKAALRQTKKLLKQEKVVLFEPAIAFGDFFVRVDILKKNGNKIELIEVKAKSFQDAKEFVTKEGDIRSEWQPYLYDVAFQTWVFEQAYKRHGFQVRPFLMLTDKTKTASVDGLNQKFKLVKIKGRTHAELNGRCLKSEANLLTAVPVAKHVQRILQGKDAALGNTAFAELAKRYARLYVKDKRGESEIGSKCKKCEFRVLPEKLPKDKKSGFDECWRKPLGKRANLAEPLIFDVWELRPDKYLEQGIYLMKDIPLESLDQNGQNGKGKSKNSYAERQRLQIVKTCHEKNPREQVDSRLFQEMDKWSYPLHFIDFETSTVAIPFNKGRRPYEQLAFQFSCHIVHQNGKIEHSEWIKREPGEFPNYGFLVALKKALYKSGTIFRYAAHENTVLRQIRAQLEQDIGKRRPGLPSNPQALIRWIDSVTEWTEEQPAKAGKKKGKAAKKKKKSGRRNMVDMLELVTKYYYHPDMGGDNSIKAVLPAIFSGKVIKKKYSQPYRGTNFSDKPMVWWQKDRKSKKPMSPYKLLPALFDDLDLPEEQRILDQGNIAEGGAALLAYARMQFTEMTDEERQAIIAGLLKYCELDTLAMVMIYEHWQSLKP